MTSYEPLFLKYRPQALSDVLGQSSVKETLINAINNSKIVHAYLLTGPRGSGKTSTARILAKSLNCTAGLDGKSPTVEPCGTCASCESIANSSSIDVTEIDAASHGGVDDARLLIEKVNLASVSGKYRVYIIDEVHMLSSQAFNALLKIIEEPPANVVFILATTESHKVMKTIASRCQQLRFNSISPLDCLDRLGYVSSEEKINIEKEALELIASHADGAMRDALSLLDQLSVFSDDAQAITEDKVLEIIGAIPSEELKKLTESIICRKPEELTSRLNDLLTQGKDSIGIVQGLSSYFLEILEELNSTQAKEKLQPILEVLKNENIENYEIVQILDSLTELEMRMTQSIQNKNLLKAWLIKICHRVDILVVKDLLERVKKLEAGEAQTRPATASPQVSTPTRAPTNSPKPSPMPQAPVTAPASAASQSNHESFLDYLSPGSKGMFISSQAKLAKVDAGSAYIEMPTKFGFLKAKLESRAEEFLSAISKDSGTEVKSFNIELMEMKEAVSPRLEKQTVQVKPLKEEMNLSEKIPEPSQERVLAESSGEACVNRPETESFSGALQETQNTPSHQETKLKEAADAALTIFGGREV